MISQYNVSMAGTSFGHKILHLAVSKAEVKSGMMMPEQDWFFHFFYVDAYETRLKVILLESNTLRLKEKEMEHENYQGA